MSDRMTNIIASLIIGLIVAILVAALDGPCGPGPVWGHDIHPRSRDAGYMMANVCRKPCSSCPWRVDQDASAIPNFNLDLAESLASTCPDERGYSPDFGSPQFACHQSRMGSEVVCAGWLATNGGAHVQVRMQVIAGQIPVEALSPGEDWPPLHAEFAEVIEKLRAMT